MFIHYIFLATGILVIPSLALFPVNRIEISAADLEILNGTDQNAKNTLGNTKVASSLRNRYVFIQK